MKKKILIVEDQFIEANNLQIILEKAGYHVCSIARSVPIALEIVARENPDMVLLDIFLQGNLTGIDLARKLRELNIGFVFLSANSNHKTLNEAKLTRPYGFLVKPFREKDILVTLDIAWYLHQQFQETKKRSQEVAASPANAAQIPELRSIVGISAKWKQLLDEIRVVAPSDTSVLLLGESGTGKELIASAIHQLSTRAGKPFIKVNCAALPVTLIESELFGHERGSFTGALEKRIGRFEMANGGSIFLDEVGEMPIETQVKLLRVLQEREIDRIGGRSPIKIDVRVIAATNRNLEKEVAESRFRMDLYYRLNVFPVTLPPLRERKEDIPLLAMYFLKRFATQNKKNIADISSAAMEQLLKYDWPGNIRELENQVERAVLLTNGPTVAQFLFQNSSTIDKIERNTRRIKTIDENERDHIIAALKECKGKISGEGGAAELLNIHVSTLNSRIKKHGIIKEHFFS